MIGHTFDLFTIHPEISQQLSNGKPYLDLDYHTLEIHDPKYAEELLKNPEPLLKPLTKTASELAGHEKLVRIINLPHTTPIHELRSQHNYNLVQVEGTIILRTGILSRPSVLIYKCPICNADIPVEQNEQWLKHPDECVNCDNRKGFTKYYEKTIFDDYQWIQLQELNENTAGSRAPSKIKVLLKNNHVETCEVGDRVKLVVIPKVLEQSQKSSNLELKTYLDCIGLMNFSEEETSQITEEMRQKFHELVETDNYIENLIDNTAPSLYGLRDEKLFINLQQVGGVSKHSEGEYKRGSIHGWFPGDPSEGKSVLMEWSVRMSQKGIYASGGGATGVGLTASVRHDKDLGEWVLDPGALVLADNGHVGIDEIEKMRDEDREAIHPAMEQQRVFINKAGINADMFSRCSVLGASNPKSGKWNKYVSISENIDNLPPALVTRFDCIFLFINDREWKEEQKRAEHVISVHRKKTGLKRENIPEKTLKQFFVYARTFKPELTDEVTERLLEVYKTLFEAGKAQETETVMITLRLLEGLIRLAEASAKLHLREVTTMVDADIALRVMKASLFKSALNPETGLIDVSQFYKDSGKAKSKKDRYDAIEKIIRDYTRENDCRTVNEVTLLSLLYKSGIKTIEATSLLNGMEYPNSDPARIYRNGSEIALA